jgi:hypothetical protein
MAQRTVYLEKTDTGPKSAVWQSTSLKAFWQGVVDESSPPYLRRTRPGPPSQANPSGRASRMRWRWCQAHTPFMAGCYQRKIVSKLTVEKFLTR